MKESLVVRIVITSETLSGVIVVLFQVYRYFVGEKKRNKHDRSKLKKKTIENQRYSILKSYSCHPSELVALSLAVIINFMTSSSPVYI